MDWMLILGWGSPIGMGIFLVCLGGMIFLLTKANIANKSVDKKEKDNK